MQTDEEKAALAAFRQKNNDDDDLESASPRDQSTKKKVSFSAEKILNIPQTLWIGETEFTIMAYESRRAKAVQELIWSQVPGVVLSAALSKGEGINPEEALRLFCSIDTEASELIAEGDEEGAADRWRMAWRSIALQTELVTTVAAKLLSLMAVDKNEAPLNAESIEELLSERDLSMPDLVSLLQTLLEINGGFPGDIRRRF